MLIPRNPGRWVRGSYFFRGGFRAADPDPGEVDEFVIWTSLVDCDGLGVDCGSDCFAGNCTLGALADYGHYAYFAPSGVGYDFNGSYCTLTRDFWYEVIVDLTRQN